MRDIVWKTSGTEYAGFFEGTINIFGLNGLFRKKIIIFFLFSLFILLLCSVYISKIYFELNSYRKLLSDERIDDFTYPNTALILSYYIDGANSKHFQNLSKAFLYQVDVDRLSNPYLSKLLHKWAKRDYTESSKSDIDAKLSILLNSISSDNAIAHWIATGACNELKILYSNQSIDDKLKASKLGLECAYSHLMLYKQDFGKYPEWLEDVSNDRDKYKAFVCKNDKYFCRYEDVRWTIGLCSREIYLSNNKRCISNDVFNRINENKFCQDMSLSECRLLDKYLRKHLINLFIQ